MSYASNVVKVLLWLSNFGIFFFWYVSYSMRFYLQSCLVTRKKEPGRQMSFKVLWMRFNYSQSRLPDEPEPVDFTLNKYLLLELKICCTQKEAALLTIQRLVGNKVQIGTDWTKSCIRPYCLRYSPCGAKMPQKLK